MENISIKELSISSRAYNALRMKGITKINQLTLLNSQNIYEIRNIGYKTAKEIIDSVHKSGYTFRDEREEPITLDTKVEHLKMSSRLSNILIYEGYMTIRKICSLSLEQINHIRGLGETTKEELIETIHKLGYKFKGEEEQTSEQVFENLLTERERLVRNKENLEKTIKYIEKKLVNIDTKIVEIKSSNRK